MNHAHCNVSQVVEDASGQLQSLERLLHIFGVVLVAVGGHGAADGGQVEHDANLLVAHGRHGKTDAASEEGPAVEGVFPFEGDLDLVCGDLLFQGHQLVIITEKKLIIQECGLIPNTMYDVIFCLVCKHGTSI